MTMQEERNWAMAAHIGTLIAAWVAMGFIAPLGVLLISGEKSAFVKRHAVESLNFQISLLIYLFAGVVLVLATLGLGALIVVPVALVLAFFALLLIVLGTLAAGRGEDYRYLLCIRLIR